VTSGVSIMPGGGISRRPLHLFILADCSGSMKVDGRMQALNFALASMLPHLATWEKEQEQAQVFVRVITFADEAEWHIKEPLPVRSARWTPLQYVEKGLTAMGAAFRLVAEELQPGRIQARALRPAILLVTAPATTILPSLCNTMAEAETTEAAIPPAPKVVSIEPLEL